MSRLELTVNLRNCQTMQDVAARFSEVCAGENFDIQSEDLDCSKLSSALISFSGNYISIDDIEGKECFYVEIFDTAVEAVNLYVKIMGKEVAYYNKNSGWYLVNDNYKDTDAIEDEEINLNNFTILEIESDECDIDYGFDSMNGVGKCYTWSCQDGNWYLEEGGCFTKFKSSDDLEFYMNNNERF